ncbi:hypothetical protein [Arenimonas sp.]|uniref:hypothetical protein n=1 Tax=Arenimonas sp. TaxID=1872635 RepID=UPI0025C223A4|nr:hypothetical protein [Arenimonas sp.]
MRPQQNSLDTLVNEPVQIEVGGVALHVTPLTVGQLPTVLRLAQPFLLLLDTVRSAEDALALIADHGDAIVAIAAIAADVPQDQVARLTPDLLAELFIKLLELNADFFGPRLPALQARVAAGMARLQAKSPAGPTPSPN